MSVCPIPAGGQSQEPRSVRARLTGNIWLPLSYHSVKIKPRVFLHRSPFFFFFLFPPALPLMFPSLRDEIACCTNPFAGEGREGERDNQAGHWAVFPKCSPKHYCAQA